MNNKKIFFGIFLILFLVSLSAVSAGENGTDIASLADASDDVNKISVTFDDTVNIESDNDDSILSVDDENSKVGIDIEGDVYFNASASRDGDGTQANPFKYVAPNRLPYGCTAYFADGVYEISSTCYLRSNDGSALFDVPTKVTFYGESTTGTIFKCTNSSIIPFCVDDNSRLYAYNMTFDNAVVQNNGRFEAYGIIFKNGVAVDTTAAYYTPARNNAFGGAIYSPGSHYATYGSGMKSYLTIVDCLFMNNSAVYGGSIYHNYGDTIIRNTKFYDSYASLYGGVLATDGGTIKIENCEFINCGAAGDAGGAIYSKTTDLSIKNANFTNGYGDFGGAICNLNSNLIIENANFINNSAKYEGGAIYVMYGNVTIKNCDISISSALDGGAVFADNCSSVNIIKTNFDKSSATRYGGTIFSNGNSVNLEDVVLGESTAAIGPVVYHQDKYDYDIAANTDYIMMRYNSSYAGVLPSRFDLRELGYVTPVRDQQAGGNCWAFAGIAALESCILKATGKSYDLSEENLKNLVELYSAYGWKYDTNGGGHSEMSWGHFISWLGPVLEENDVYDDYSTLSTLFDAIMHVQNVYYLPARQNALDNDAIKKAIMDYGAVSVGIYWDDSPMNWDEKTASYFVATSTSAYANHAVTIVGWDDNYDKNNFPLGDMAETNGAWIVKNSWGEDWGDDGYFYVSYYDPVVYAKKTENDVFTFILNDTVKYNRNYQYDIGGMTDFLYPGASTVWYKNTFTAIGNDILSAFSTIFLIENDYEAKIYINDELKLTQSGHSFGGYATIPLKEELQLTAGDNFTVEIKVSKSEEIGFPICEVVTATRLTYESGISFFSTDGKTWNDLYTFTLDRPDFDNGHRYDSQVACIKAFTRSGGIVLGSSVEIPEINTNAEEPTPIVAIIKDENGKLIQSGYITFEIGDDTLTIKVENGRAEFEYTFDSLGTYVVNASYNGMNVYNNTTASAKINVDKAIVKNDAKFNAGVDKNQITYGDSITLTHSIDSNATGSVLFYDGDKLIGTVNVGRALENIKLAGGVHTITARYSGAKYYKNASVEIVVNVAKKEDYTFIVNPANTQITVDVASDATGAVKAVINGKDYIGYIEDGKAIIDISGLEDGKYTADISYAGDDNYANKSQKVSFEISNFPEVDDSKGVVIIRDASYPNNANINVAQNYTPVIEYYVNIPNGDFVLVNDLIIFVDGTAITTINPQSNTYSKYNINIPLNQSGNHVIVAQYKYWVWGVESGETYSNTITYNVIAGNGTDIIQNQTNETVPGQNTTDDTNNTNQTTPEIDTTTLTIRDAKYPNSSVISISDEYSPEIEYYVTVPSGDLLSNEIIIKCNGVGIATIENPADKTYTKYKLPIVFNETGRYVISAQYKYYIFMGLGDDIDSNSITYIVNIVNETTPISNETKNESSQNDTPGDVSDKISSKVVVTSITSDCKITGILTDMNGVAIPNAEVKYVLDGKSDIVKTDNSGKFTIQGLYNRNIDFVFEGNDKYSASNMTFSVEKQNEARLATQFNVTAGLSYTQYAIEYDSGERGQNFTVQLLDQNGKALANKEILVGYNGKILNRTTDATGHASVQINLRDANRLTFAVTFLGDENYNATMTVYLITIVKKPVTMTASAKTFKASAKTKKYTVSLKTIKGASADGKTYFAAGKKVTMKINGKTYSAKTNAKGQATFNLKITKKGTFSASINYAGDNTYKAVSKNVKIKIN